MLKETDMHIVKFCQCTFAQYLEKMSEDNSGENNDIALPSDRLDNVMSTKEKEYNDNSRICL